jgi:N-methylhydantoinase B
MQSIEVKSKPGTVVHSEWPAGCCKATTGASWEVDNLVSACVGKMLAASESHHKYFQAGWMGSQAIDHIAGMDQRGRRYQESILDSMFGGTGARSDQDGIDTGGFLCSISLGIANVETYENLAPVFFLYRRQLADSGGPGTFRGGATISSAYCLNKVGTNEHKAASSGGVSHPATSGIYGGYPSSTVQFIVKRESNIRETLSKGSVPQSLDQVDGELEHLGEMTLTRLGRDDAYFFVSTGGGGYGDPLERKPEMVLKDYSNFLVSLDGARELYGIEISADGKTVDPAKTEERRNQIREKRIGKPVALENRSSKGARGLRLNNYLRLVDGKGEKQIACRCGLKLCGADENYKLHILQKEFPITAAGPHVNPSPRAPRKTFVWREFYCPQCALLMTTEVALEGDPIVWELKPG